MILRLPICLLLTGMTVGAAEPMASYLMGYFIESSNIKRDSWALHLATSDDGFDWMPLNQNEPVLVPDPGQKGLVDPFFLRKEDGGFVVLAAIPTSQNTDAQQEIKAWDTADFVTFTNPRLLKLHDTPMQTTAPEAFFDPDRKQYVITWAGRSDRNRLYANYTSDFENLSPSDLFFDPGFNVEGGTLFQNPDHSEYFLYYQDYQVDRLRGAHSPTLDLRSFEGKTYATPPAETSFGAPRIVKALHENRWFLFGQSDSGISAWQSNDIAKDSWKEINKRDFNFPSDAKHATVIPVTNAEKDRIIARWGRPNWNRVKCWNFPDHFVRHDLSIGKISASPLDPTQDSQWRIVPGLATDAGVSFESVDLPGNYLRTVAEHVVVAKDDGSKGFRTRATFTKEPGLADGSWTSFRSFSSPDLYLRHANFFLRLEAIVSQEDKEDATFRIVY